MAVRWVAFHLTDRCQLDCQHCLRDPAQKPKDLPVGLVRKALHEARELYGTKQVALTGGEPTLHPEFPEIIDAIVDAGCSWHMVTNGRRFPQVLAMLRARPRRLGGLTAVNLSLDGADEATHDVIRGIGSFREVMTAASVCAASGIPFVLQMVLNAKNAHQIEAMGLLASQLGAKQVSFSMLQATGTHHDASLGMTARQWRDAKDRVDRMADVLRMPVATPEGFYQEQAFHVCEAFTSSQLHIDVEGRLNLCCQHAGIPAEGARSDVVADLATTSLAEAHGRLLALIHEVQAERLRAIAKRELGEWDHFPCNWCMKQFGKPHWTDEGAGGPDAKRERWRGAWAPEVKAAAAARGTEAPAPRVRGKLPILR